MQACQAMSTINTLSRDRKLVDMPSAAAVVSMAIRPRPSLTSHAAEYSGGVSSPLKTSFLHSDVTKTGLSEYMSTLCALHENGFDDNILSARYVLAWVPYPSMIAFTFNVCLLSLRIVGCTGKLSPRRMLTRVVVSGIRPVSSRRWVE